MTIVFFANTSWYLFNFRLDFAEKLRREEHRVIFASRRDGNYDKQIEEKGFTFIDVQLARGKVSLWRNLRAIFDLAKSLRDIRADVIHNYTIQSILLGTIAGRLAGIKFFVNSFTGLGSVLGQGSSQSIVQRLVILALRLVMRRGKFRVIAQNDTDYHQLISSRLRPATEIVLIRGSGINLDKFPGKSYTMSSSLSVVCLARLIKDKGIREYVQAASIVTKKDPNIKFLLAGSEDTGNPNSIATSLLDKWQRQSNVEFLGHVDDARSLLDRSDLLVLPSYREGFPRTILEAFAMELPVITSDVPGCRDIVEHGVNGLLVPPRNAEALALAILELTGSPALCRSFGVSGRRLVQNNYSSDAHAKEMKAVYSDLVGGS